MKNLFLLLFTFAAFTARSQVVLEDNDFTRLLEIAREYGANQDLSGPYFQKQMEALSTPKLANITETFIQLSKGKKYIFDKQFLQRPANEELQLWYGIQKVTCHRGDTLSHESDSLVLLKALSTPCDERLLLDSYYGCWHNGLTMLFNKSDLSKTNIDLNNLGFKNATEKAICFLNIMDGLLGARFGVLNMMQNYKALEAFAGKLPTVNGKPYYSYILFSYPDFVWVDCNQLKNYNEDHVSSLYSALIFHFVAARELNHTKLADDIYYNSILFAPQFFHYSPAEEDLKKLHGNMER